MAGSGAAGSLIGLGAKEPAVKSGPLSATSSKTPNSHPGRCSIPHLQARGPMEANTQYEVFVGIDVAKRQLDVHLLPSGESFALERTPAGLEQLAETLRAHAPRLIVLEATGGLEVVVCASLAAAGLPVVAVNPRQIRAFAVALGRWAKTDTLDAAVIARFAERVRPAIRPLPDAQARVFGELVIRRQQVVG